MCSHNGAKSSSNGFSGAKSAIFGQSQEKILGQFVHLEFVASSGQTIGLEGLFDGRIGQEISESAVFFESFLKGFQVLLYNFKRLLLGCGRIESGGISAFGSKNLNGRLNKLKATDGGGKASGKYSQMTREKKNLDPEFG